MGAIGSAAAAAGRFAGRTLVAGARLGFRAAGLGARGVGAAAAGVGETARVVAGIPGGFLRHAYETDWALQGIGRISGKFFSSYSEGCTITVTGGPNSDMKRLTQLALSTAFGLVPDFGGGAGPKTIQLSFDYMNRSAQCRYMQVYNGVQGALSLQDGPSRLAQGPNLEIDGGSWPSVGAAGINAAFPLPDGATPNPDFVPKFKKAVGIAAFPLGSGGIVSEMVQLQPGNTIVTYATEAANALAQPLWDTASRDNVLLRLATQIIMGPCCPPQPADQSQFYGATVAENPPFFPPWVAATQDKYQSSPGTDPLLPDAQIIRTPTLNLLPAPTLNIQGNATGRVLNAYWRFQPGVFDIQNQPPFSTAKPLTVP